MLPSSNYREAWRLPRKSPEGTLGGGCAFRTDLGADSADPPHQGWADGGPRIAGAGHSCRSTSPGKESCYFSETVTPNTEHVLVEGGGASPGVDKQMPSGFSSSIISTPLIPAPSAPAPSVSATLETVESVVEAEVTLLQSLQIYLQRKFRHEQNPGATLLCFFPEAEKIHFLFTHPYAFLALMNRPERPTTEARNWHLKALPLRKQPPLPRTCSQVTP